MPDPEDIPPVERRYEVVDELGRGGMGRVLLGRDPDLGRTVAVKILLDRAVRDEETRTRFLREAQLTAQLEHPHILPVYALEHSETGAPAFSMKVVRGRTFSDLIDACREASEAGEPLDGELALEHRLDLFLRVCDAIAYAHDRGVIHRDLKPDNLMLGAFGEVYVVDWGIARLAGEGEETPEELAAIPEGLTTATQLGYAVGSPAYMSPEQAVGENERVGPASDQYALGLILQELLTFRRANDTGDVASTLGRAIRGEREPLVSPAGRVPRDLEHILYKATALYPEDRYPSVAAFAEDLRRYLRHEETIAHPDPWWRKPVRWTLRHPGTATSLGVGITLLGLLAVTGITLAAVIGLALNQAAAHRHEQAMTDLVRTVGDHAHHLDAQLLYYEGLLERLAGSTVHLLQHGEPTPAPFYTLDALRAGEGPDDFGPSALYDQGVTLQAPAVVLSPGVTVDDVRQDLWRLGPLTRELHRAVIRSHGPAATTLAEDAQRHLILEEGVPLGWSYVGLEQGVLLNYPGNTMYSPDYDARERSWYKEARGTHGPAWGEPYPDDSGRGLLLPCNQALYADDGAFLGVASVSVVLGEMVEELLAGSIPGLRTAYVVDPQGLLVVASDQEDLDLWAGLNEGRALDKEPFPEPAVRRALIRQPAGHLAAGGDLYLWARMDTVGWTYVARVDAEAALEATGAPAR